MHAFDHTFRQNDRLSDARLVRATQALARRAVGIADPQPPGAPAEDLSRLTIYRRVG
jgi:hypothetical protein